jgi:predicted ATP-dependent serine protease
VSDSSRAGTALERSAAFGEIGLTGRLRAAAQAERRLDECAKLGIQAVLVPEGTAGRELPRVLPAETLRGAIRGGLERAREARAPAAA